MRKKKPEELNRLSIDEYKRKTKVPFEVVLDQVRSEHNVGSVFRTCDAFLIEKIYLCGITPVPPSSGIHKTALGATESVDYEYHSSTRNLLLELRNKKKMIVGLEQVNDKSLLLDHTFSFRSPELILVIGNEMFGLSEDILDLCDYFIEIPQFGTKHSLNVSVAFGIVAYAYFTEFYTLYKK
ncbi:MAG: RNA methyltransferase [Bacteroidales bacterium]|nr:RNA methyltransferase [Bacteroidales bacterium]